MANSKDKRTCKVCGETKFISEFYTNGLHYGTTCKPCSCFLKKAQRYEAKMSKEEYEEWYEENKPKKIVVDPYDMNEMLKGYKYRNLSEYPYNCYVKRLDEKEIYLLERLLKCKIKYRETTDKDGYILEAKNE